MSNYTKNWSFLMPGLLLLACLGQAQTPPDPAPDPGGPPNIFYGAVRDPHGMGGPVVVFVHGLGSNALYWWTDSNTMYQAAWAAGYRTAFISFSDDNSNNSDPIASNAAKFQTMLPQILSYYSADQAYVVSMSKGGLDVQYAMLDQATRQKIRALFTLATPNQGSAFADWAFGDGLAILQQLCIDYPALPCLLSPGVADLQVSNVQAIRAQVDPIFTSEGIPVFTLTGNDFTKGGNPVTLVTGLVLKNLTGEENDGLVTVSESLLDSSFAMTLGQVGTNHFDMGFGVNSFAYVRGRIDGLENAISGFKKVGTGGLGDRFNTWAWTMRWFKGKLYVGSGRSVQCAIIATSDIQNGTTYYPPLGIECPPDVKDLPMRAEIWRYTPETKTWERVYQSPQDIPIGTNADGFPAFAAREIGFRELFVHTESDGTQALYAGGVSGNSLFGTLPEWAPDNYPPPRILRSVDGVNWQPIPQDPGTFMGDIIKNNPDINVVSFRSFKDYKGMLFASVCNLRGEGFIVASADPKAGNNAWQRVSPDDAILPVWDLEVFNNFLYVGTGDRESDEGYGVFKTDAASLDPNPCTFPGCQPYIYTPIITEGAFQTDPNLRSPVALTLAVSDNMLYVGTDRKTEMVRIHPDDTWELVVGAPRVSPTAFFYAPISGIGTYFDNPFNGHFWQMLESNKGLHLGTWDSSVQVQPLEQLNRLVTSGEGFDLMRSDDGVHWYAISRIGMGDGQNFGGRSMEFTPFGFFVGTSRPDGGFQIWFDGSVLDYNGDQIIDQNDVNVILAALGQPASGPTDPRDLDRDGEITVLDARKLMTQCTFPGCTSAPPAARRRLAARVSPPTLLHAQPKRTSGNGVVLDWQPSPDAVRYRVYRITARPLRDFIGGGARVTIPGTDIQATILDVQSGKLDYLCAPDLTGTATCSFIDAVKVTTAVNTQIGFLTATELVGLVTEPSFQETAPTQLQSLYFVRAEDANNKLSEPSNIVGAPSKALN